MAIRRETSAQLVDGWAEGDEADLHALTRQEAAAAGVFSTPSYSAEAATRGGFYRRRGKRVLDLALGIPLALVALPIVVASAAAVLITSGRPIFYRATRIGRGGREFSMWKLRTMVPNAEQVLADWLERNPELAAEYQANFKLRDDPRVVPFGRFLRRTSLDELPQLLNVLRGDMSLVGPRPYFDHELEPFPATRIVDY